MTAPSRSIRGIALFLTVVVLFPAGYLGLVGLLVPRPILGLVPGLQDSSFIAWNLTANKVPGAVAHAQNGILTVSASGNLFAGSILLAERILNASISLKQFRYLSLQVRTDSLFVAAKVLIWTNSTSDLTLLLKTYNDSSWHTEIIDLFQFGLKANFLYSIQLGWQLLKPQNTANASFTQLSLNALD